MVQFRADIAAILDDVLLGQRYTINARMTPRLTLRPLLEDPPEKATLILMDDFRRELFAVLKHINKGRCYVVQPEPGDTSNARGPVASALIADRPTREQIQRRRAQYAAERKLRTRERVRDIRERERLNKDPEAPLREAKLQAVEGLSVAQVKEAVRLLKRKNR